MLLLLDRSPNDKWLDKINQHVDNLKRLVNDYHPSIGLGRSNMNITAPNAEAACDVVRERIRKTSVANPVEQFIVAVKNREIWTIYNLLSDTWFGVPESTDCWRLSGFRELVDLLDEPPEMENN